MYVDVLCSCLYVILALFSFQGGYPIPGRMIDLEEKMWDAEWTIYLSWGAVK